tara:strand:- start:914 stop:1981 length:1068 start_codon:yes stop_codon:yes gene_type:complete
MRVCILGNGLSATSLAKALVNQNIYVDIFTEKKELKLNKSRTLGISNNNINYFNEYIINIEKLIWKLKKIEIFSENLKRENLLNFENNNNYLFSTVKNYDLYELLIKDLNKNKYYKKKIYRGKSLSFINEYDLIINCDYFHHITKKYFNKKIVKEYNSRAYTTIIKHENILNDSAIQIFTKKGPLAFLPISNKETSIVYSINKKEENIEELIKSYNFRYKINEIGKIDSFELKFLNLRSYYHNNILAFGDLLHRIHPLAGQGFNMTIRDIKTFINIIKNRNELGLPLDISVNDEFENSLKHKNYIFSNGVDLIHKFFNLERKTKNTILSKSIQVLGKNPSINKMFTKIADKGIIF